MFAHAGFSAFARKSPEQGGDPFLLPGRRQGAAAAGQTGAAGASQRPVVVLAAGKVFGEEAAIICGAGSAEGARGAQILEHAGLVAVVGHHAPVAAVAGEAQAAAAHGGTH